VNNPTQIRRWIQGIYGRTAGASLALAIMLVPAVLATGSAQAQIYTERVLYSFNSSPDGQLPMAGLVRDAQGNLYGTTAGGGVGCGTVFKVDSTGNETVLYTFPGTGVDGSQPQAGLVLDAQGNLYGTTLSGGAYYMYGTVFKVDAAGNETVLHSFGRPGSDDGANPLAGLVRDAQGNLYGTTVNGGHCCGTVFKVDSTGRETVLYNFTGGWVGGRPRTRSRFSAGCAGQPVWHYLLWRRSYMQRVVGVRHGVQAGCDRQRDRASQLHRGWGGRLTSQRRFSAGRAGQPVWHYLLWRS